MSFMHWFSYRIEETNRKMTCIIDTTVSTLYNIYYKTQQYLYIVAFFTLIYSYLRYYD